jgi:hypothetical protein
MRVVKSFIGYNKKLGMMGFGGILFYAAIGSLLMYGVLVAISSDGALHHLCHRDAAWIFCFPIKAADWLSLESWLPSWLPSWWPLVLVLAFNFIVPYLLLWLVQELKQTWQNRRSRWTGSSSTAR